MSATNRRVVLQLVALTAIACSIAYGQDTPRSEGPSPSAAMEMPFREFAEAKGVEPHKLARALGLPETSDLEQPLAAVLSANGLSRADIQDAMARLDPLAAEASRKDWSRIRLKFALWILFFVAAMIILTRVPVTRPLRVAMLALAVVIFGVWLGVEPNAPGTVKDGLVLYGTDGAIFLPRLVAFGVLMLMSIIGNKIFCGWGCHFGTLQDLVSQINVKKIKPPFWLSNAIRVSFFAAVAIAAIGFGTDIMEAIDPFRIFRLGAAVAVGVAVVVLVAGVWIYRPWCTFMCPFGLVSWVGERIALTRPRVNHDICIDCKSCERACPTHSMEGNRAGRRFHQDCFACGACIRSCPVSAIGWGVRPPAAPEPTDETGHGTAVGEGNVRTQPDE